MSAQFAKIVDGVVASYPYGLNELRKDNPNVSLPRQVTVRIMRQFGAHPVEQKPVPAFDPLTEIAVRDAVPSIDHTHYITEEQATDEETGEIDETLIGRPIHTCSIGYAVQQFPLNKAARNVRDKRDGLLGDTDWIVAVSYERGEPVPAEWASYRQALRDITTQQGFPYEIIWPIKPE